MLGKAISLCVSLLFAVQCVSFPAGVDARQGDVPGQAQTGPAPAAAEPRGRAAVPMPDPAPSDAETAAVLASAIQVPAAGSGGSHTCAPMAGAGSSAGEATRTANWATARRRVASRRWM